MSIFSGSLAFVDTSYWFMQPSPATRLASYMVFFVVISASLCAMVSLSMLSSSMLSLSMLFSLYVGQLSLGESSHSGPYHHRLHVYFPFAPLSQGLC